MAINGVLQIHAITHNMRASTKLWLKRMLICFTYIFVIINLWRYTIYVSSYTRESEIGENQTWPIGECDSQPIKCLIDNQRQIDCIQQADEVYFPFSFLQKRFEVYGNYSQNGSFFEMMSTTGRVPESVEQYNPTGSHADDVRYFVEGRPYVRQVDGIRGVPICIQWFPDGFFFSTNIAQFGLSHYSQHFFDPYPKNFMIIDKGYVVCDTERDDSSTFTQRGKDTSEELHTTHFKTSSSFTSQGIKITCSLSQQNIMRRDRLNSMTVKGRLKPNSSLTFDILRSKDKQWYKLIYVTNETRLLSYNNTFIFGIGNRDSPSTESWSRNLFVDVEHGIIYRDKLKDAEARIDYKRSKCFIRVRSIILRGEGYLYDIKLAGNAHIEHFYDAAKWMLENQDANGGWPMPVSHELGTYTLQPGWYTALGQGLGMSVLCRAYHMTKNDTYLSACAKATKVFHMPSDKGGVRAVFLNQYVWYEEYPTLPSSFVLNGFMTALLGLYDLSQIGKDADAKALFDDGMKSLKALLPLFDSGSGSLYDLRHVTMHTDPNRCRPDYHNVHIELLMHFATIDNATIFRTFSERWKKYKNGWLSRHN